MRSTGILAVATLVIIGSPAALEAQAVAVTPTGKPMICVVMPDVQMGQGASAAADPSGAVVNSLVGYLSGPAADVQVLQARIPVQFTAEAVQRGCGFIVESGVVHKKAGKGLSGLLAAAPALISAAPYMGGAASGMGNYATAQVAAAAAQGAAAAQAQQAQEEAQAAMSGVAQSNIKKGDQVTVNYKLYRPGGATPAAGKELKAKAAETGHDILSPLLEQLATDVLTTALAPAG